MTAGRAGSPFLWIAQLRLKRRTLLLLGCAVVETLSLPFFLYLQNVPILGGDGPVYDELARNLLDRASFSSAYGPNISRSIGYPGFIAAIYALSHRSYFALRIVQTLLLLGASWGLHKVALYFVDRRTAVVAGMVCAFYLPFVLAANYHLTEIPTVFLSVVIALIFMKLIKIGDPKPGSALALGLIAGATALLRPSFALLPGILSVAILSSLTRRTWKSRTIAVALIAAGYITLVAPWTVRNAVVSHRLIPLATGSGTSLYVSALQYTGRVSYKLTVPEWGAYIADYLKRVSEAERVVETTGGRPGIDPAVDRELIVDQRYRHEAGELAFNISLGQLPYNIATRFLYFWSTGDMSPWNSLVLHRVVQIQHAILMLLAGVGVWLSRRRPLTHWPLWIVPVYLVAIHFVFHMEPRYSFPARPFLFIYSAVALIALKRYFRGDAFRDNSA